ncbi:MAG: hypothetical protein DHS20C15_00490 [Planctomycetota bacterium]|nr:MAG: hypothetical protein DHS20C15_00490 [Planctomycetota bacterium]
MNVRVRRVVFPVLALAAVLLLASTVSEVLSPVLFAVLLAVILNPVVNAAERIQLPRVLSVSLMYVGLIVLFVFFASMLNRQFGDLIQALEGEPFHGDLDGNGLINLAGGAGAQNEFSDLDGDGKWDGGALVRLRAWVDAERSRLHGSVWGELAHESGDGLLDVLEGLAVPATGMVASGLERLAEWAGGFVALLTLLVLIPFYLFFFLVEYRGMSQALNGLVPPRHRGQVHRITRDIGKELAAFLRGRLACGMVKAAFLWGGMFVLGLPFALPVALIAGLLAPVPFLGFLVGVLPASVFALTMPGGGTDTLFWVIGVFAAGELLEGAVLFPLLLGRETGLHPVTLVVVLLMGGALMGTLGVLVAIPLALICKVLWRELGLPWYRAWAEDDAAENAALAGAAASSAEPAAAPQDQRASGAKSS